MSVEKWWELLSEINKKDAVMAVIKEDKQLYEMMQALVYAKIQKDKKDDENKL